MALKRPVAGDPVTVEDFGQPVYDFITTVGGIYAAVRTSSAVITVNVPITCTLTNVRAKGVTVGATSLTFPTAGWYRVWGTCLFYASNIAGTYTGITVKRAGSDLMQGVGGVGYWVNLPFNGLLYLAANDVLSITANTDMPAGNVESRTGAVTHFTLVDTTA